MNAHVDGDSIQAFIREQMGDPKRRQRIEQGVVRLQLAQDIVAARRRLRLTRAQFGRRIGTPATAVARMEQGSYGVYRLATLVRIARATGGRRDLRLVVARRRSKRRGGTISDTLPRW
jgi:DNA-binding transcriptional regulator YiaG